MELDQKVRDFIDYARVCRLATADASGQPHVVPVCPILIDGRIYVASEDNRKVHNVRENPRVSLSFDDYVEDWSSLRGVIVFGSVARDQARSGSDVDLLVDLPPGTSLLDHSALKLELEDLLQQKVDLLRRRNLKPSLRQRVEAEAVALG